jgi:hypothetical protein
VNTNVAIIDSTNVKPRRVRRRIPARIPAEGFRFEGRALHMSSDGQAKRSPVTGKGDLRNSESRGAKLQEKAAVREEAGTETPVLYLFNTLLSKLFIPA